MGLDCSNARSVRQTPWRNKLVTVTLLMGLLLLLLLVFAGTALANAFTMLPSGDVKTALTGTQPHYALVSDGWYSTAVSTTSASILGDSYSVKIPDHINSGPIKSVTVWVRVRASMAYQLSHGFAKTYLKTGSAEFVGAQNMLPDTGWHEYSTTYTQNPATKKAWTASELSALSLGVQLNSAYETGSVTTWCSEVWAVVDYCNTVTLTPSANGTGIQLMHRPTGTASYVCVSDNSDDSYVTNWPESDAFKRDLFVLTPSWNTSAPPAGTIESVTLGMRLSRSLMIWAGADVDLRSCARGVIARGAYEAVTGGITIDDSQCQEATDYRTTAFTKDPFTAAAWNWSQMATLQAGVAIRDAYTIHHWYGADTHEGPGYCQKFRVEVNYNGSPYTIVQPSNRNVSLGANALFTSQVSGVTCKVHWEWSTNGGRNWSDVPKTRYPSAASTTLDLGAVPMAYSGRLFRAVFSGPYGWGASSGARLTVTSGVPPVSTVTAISPAAAAIGERTIVTIAGTHLLGASAVRFGTAAAPSFTVLSDTRMTATVPATAPMGKVDVTVTTPLGTSSTVGTGNDFTYLVRLQQDYSGFGYSGVWGLIPATSASGGSYAISGQSTASVTLPFHGTRLDWIATRDAGMGSADVYVDWVLKRTVNLLYAGGTLYGQRVFSTGTLAPGPHTVRISWSSTNAPGKTISIDAVDIAPTVTLINITSPVATSLWKTGSTQTVTWTVNPACSFGEFRVWLVRASGGWYVNKQVLPVAGKTSYSTSTTVSCPPAAGYTARVYWRPVVGSGSWTSTARSAAFTVTP